MFTKMVVLFVIFLNIYVTLASDPDPVQDFCIANLAESAIASNVIQCKNSSLATVEDFVYSGIKSPGKFGQTGLSAISVNSNVFPGLNTLGMSFVRADFEVGGVNVPHYHPRATETAFVLEGRIYSGFVDTNNRIFAKVIEKAKILDCKEFPLQFLDPGLKMSFLEKAFGLSSKEIAKLKKRLGSH
ncbi:hypothetical protein M0R45_035906 [Rubus argutus]|uniref:Cupin type-1 domain-containing protein n=1 Tax=Rubus argutus TaxID=59490 RepID=A0AAW1VVG4_RUBAR